MKRNFLIPLAACALFAGLSSHAEVTISKPSSASRPAKAAEKLTAALFVEDSTVDGACRDYLPSLANRIAAELAKKGIGVIRPEHALGLSERVGTAEPGKTLLTERVPEGSSMALDLANLRQIARDLETDCYIQCSITEAETSEIGNTGVVECRVSTTLTAHGTALGDGLYGDTVTTSFRETASLLEKNGQSIFSKALGQVGVDCATRFAEAGVTKMDILPGRGTVKVRFACDVTNAVVLVDGAAVGTTATDVEAESGLHTVKISFPFCYTYEFRARFRDGQVYNVHMELTPEGLARFKDVQDYNLHLRAATAEIEKTVQDSSRAAAEFALTEYLRKLEKEQDLKLVATAAETADVIARQSAELALEIGRRSLSAGASAEAGAEAVATAIASARASALSLVYNVNVLGSEQSGVDLELERYKAETERLVGMAKTDVERVKAENNWEHIDKVWNKVDIEGDGTVQTGASESQTEAGGKASQNGSRK